MVMLRRWSVQWRENGLTEDGQFNGVRMVMLRRVDSNRGEHDC